MMETLGLICICLGALFMLLAAVGAARLPDVFMRLHAITKAGTTGIGFMVLAIACFNQEMAILARAGGALLFVALTAPISAHLISRAAYVSKAKLWRRTFIDELGDYYASRSKPAATGEPPADPPTKPTA